MERRTQHALGFGKMRRKSKIEISGKARVKHHAKTGPHIKKR